MIANGQGVYAIEHVLSGAVYIGSTRSFRNRWYEHTSKLRRGIHYSADLQKTWSRDGADAFRFRVLEIVEDPACLFPAEQRWISDHMVRGVAVYNALWGNGNTPEVIERRAAGHRGLKPHPELVRRRASSIAKTWPGFITPDGTVYRNIHNLSEFCREHDLILSHMSKVYHGRRNQHRGWVALEDALDA